MWLSKRVFLTRYFLKVLFFSTMIFVCCKAATKELKIRVVSESLPPYQIVDSNLNVTGYSVDIVKLLLARLDIEAKIEIYPWARAYKIAKNKSNVLIFSIDRTPEREKQFHWVGSVSKEVYAFYKLKFRHDIQARNLNELKQYIIGVSRASSTDQIVTRNKFPSLVRVHEPSQLVRMLHAKKVDLAFAIDFTITDVYRENDLDLSLITQLPGILESSTDFYIALSKTTEQEIVDQFVHAYKELESSGKVEEIRRKWKMPIN